MNFIFKPQEYLKIKKIKLIKKKIYITENTSAFYSFFLFILEIKKNYLNRKNRKKQIMRLIPGHTIDNNTRWTF